MSMNAQSISTSLAPEVIITQVSGDLYLKGWEKPEINVISPLDALTLEEKNDKVHLDCQGNCEVRVPHGASLRIQNVQGDAYLKLVDEPITIGEVRGSLTIRDVATLHVHMVQNDLSVRGVSGDLSANQVEGNAEIRKIRGNCYLDEIQGKLDGWDVEGEVKARSQGRIYLRLSAMRGVDYQIHSESNVHCYIPEDASLKLDLASRSQIIKIRIGEKASTVRQGHYELTTNDGEASMVISSGGSIYLLSRKPEWEEDDGAVFETVSGLVTVRAQEKIRQAQEKLESKLEATQRRHERRAEEFDRRTRHGKQSWSFQSPTPTSQTPEPEKEAVSEEERLMILRMLEQKKITLEEADKLLAVLEGKEE